MITDKIAASLGEDRGHSGGAFASVHLREIERLLPGSADASAETGCGFSTILFSNISRNHTSFCLDDRPEGKTSSVLFAQNNRHFKSESLRWVFGPTQETLPIHKDHAIYDFILIDGPHGYPFPELEYIFLFPHLRKGGLLLIDDVNIPTIGRMADILCEDEMFDPVALIGGTLALRRTDADGFDPRGDGWWLQRFNRRRVSPRRDIYLPSASIEDKISKLRRDLWVHGPDEFPQSAVIDLRRFGEHQGAHGAAGDGSVTGAAARSSEMAGHGKLQDSSNQDVVLGNPIHPTQETKDARQDSSLSHSEPAGLTAPGFIKLFVQRALGLFGYGLHRTKSIEEMRQRLQAQDASIADLQRTLRAGRQAAGAGNGARENRP
jgi:hypothetical protein